MKVAQPWMARLFAFFMCLWCLQQGWAGVLIQQGALEKAYAIDPRNPEVIFKLGKNILEAPSKDNQLSAEALFKKNVELLPNHGEGWFYLGLAVLKEKKDSQKAKEYFNQAIQVEPGSAWLQYQVGRETFKWNQKKALSHLKTSISLHQPNFFSPFVPKGSPFLRPSLELLWQQTQNLDLLTQIAPHDMGSYLVVLYFLSEKQLWKEYELIYPKFMEIQAQTYGALCDAGIQFLQQEESYQAFKVYRKAFWIRNWSYVQAQAGVLIAQERMGELHWDKKSFLGETPKETLRKILTEKEEPLQELMPLLKPLVDQSGVSELQGLYEDRLSGKSKFEAFSEQSYDPNSWWGPKIQPPVINRQGWLSRSIQLPRGEAEIEINLRSFPDREGHYGFVLIRLNEKEVRGIYVDNSNWKKFNISVRTNGGERSLKLELMNVKVDEMTHRGPVVEIGSMRIRAS